MPLVQIEMLEGRTLEQKRMLVEKVTEAVSESVNCSKEAVTIIIREMAYNHLAKGGKLRSDQ
ncbi:MAG: 2-hydroxymuconate tautomerase [Peptococcales bacterium]